MSNSTDSNAQQEQKYEVLPAGERAAMLAKEDSVFLNVAKFEQMQRVAQMLSKSDFVPSRFRGQQNVGNCMVALDMASLMKMHPVMLMRTMYIVHGEPGFEGKFISALVNNSGQYTDPLEYEWKGEQGKEEWGCRAFATRKGTDKVIYGPWVTWKMVVAEGWNKDKPYRDGTGKQRSKWNTMPEVMFMYRAATFFGRMYHSDLLMGMNTVDELEDMGHDLVRQPDGSYATLQPESGKNAGTYNVTKEAPKTDQAEAPKTETDQEEKPRGASTTEAATGDKAQGGDRSKNELSGGQSEPDENGNYEIDGVGGTFNKGNVDRDEFGTPLDHPLAKYVWHKMRGGDPEKGTGFLSYIQKYAKRFPEISDEAYNAIATKFFNIYEREMPWGKSGQVEQSKEAPKQPPTDSTGGSPGEQPPFDENGWRNTPPGSGNSAAENSTNSDNLVEKSAGEADGDDDVLNSGASKKLAAMAKQHPVEYRTVVKNRAPENERQALDWIDEINELVDFNRTAGSAGYPGGQKGEW